MSLEELVSRYIASAEHVFATMEKGGTNLSAEGVEKVVESAKAYLEDAKYYRDQRKFEVSLTSVAYCEGLLDALRLLGAVKFEWQSRGKERRER